MKGNAVGAVSAAVAWLPLLAGQVHAGSCEGSNRVRHKDAQCLHAKWDNDTNWLSHGKVEARNECPEYGTVVAKVDIKNFRDETWHLDDGETKKHNTQIYNVRHVYCCKDLSDICNKSDRLNEDGCRAQFSHSSADDQCRNVSASVNDNEECVITAECRISRDLDLWDSDTITASWPDTRNIVNCGGNLRLNYCGW